MYRAPEIISNAVILQYADRQLFVTLVTDSNSEEVATKSLWRLPWTRVADGATSLGNLETTLRSTMGLMSADINYREQLYTTESVLNSHSTFRISYLYLSRGIRWHKGSHHVGIFPITKLPPLSEEDRRILHYAIERLHAKTLYSTIPAFMLPTVFTLNDFQDVFETITGHSVDRRNFRKKIESLAIVTPVAKSSKKNVSSTYTLKDSHLTLFDKPFPYAKRS